MQKETINHIEALQGHIVTGVEIIATCQMLRITFGNSVTLELTSGWLYEANATVKFGAMDIGFYFGSDDELLETIQEDEKKYLFKVSSLIGKALETVELTTSGMILGFSGKKHIRWHSLSAQELGIRLFINA